MKRWLLSWRFFFVIALSSTGKLSHGNTISEAGHVRTLADLILLIYFYHTIAHTNMCLDVLRGLLC